MPCRCETGRGSICGGLAAWRVVMMVTASAQCSWRLPLSRDSSSARGRTCRRRRGSTGAILCGCGPSRLCGGRTLAIWATCSSCMRCGLGAATFARRVTRAPAGARHRRGSPASRPSPSAALGCVLAGLVADRAGRALDDDRQPRRQRRLRLGSGRLFESAGAADGWSASSGVLPSWPTVPQFSAAISELCDPRFVGTALDDSDLRRFPADDAHHSGGADALQGNARLAAGPRWRCSPLGPVFGIYHMARLRRDGGGHKDGGREGVGLTIQRAGFSRRESAIHDHHAHVADVGVRGAGLDQAAEWLEEVVGVVAAEIVGGVETAARASRAMVRQSRIAPAASVGPSSPSVPPERMARVRRWGRGRRRR